MNKKAVIVLSGGMDSATLLYHIINRGYEPFAITFYYGQKHMKEIKYAEKLCKIKGVFQRIIDLSSISQLLKGSALTDNIEVPKGHYEEESMKQTVVPNRNAIMLSIAYAYAISIKATDIYYGAHSGDHAIYPDCREEFVKAIDHTFKLGNYEKPTIETPFITMNKIDILKLGLKLDVPYEHTWTCYVGNKNACGKCGSCTERLEAFKVCRIIDPLEYEENENNNKK